MHTPQDLRDLIPQNKHDLTRAQAAVARGYPEVAPILPELLEWLQDLNWPVARVLAPFLASIGPPIIPHLSRVFAGDDHIWKYWLLQCIVKDCAVVAAAFRDDLIRLARAPTAAEAREELDEMARVVLESHGWPWDA